MRRNLFRSTTHHLIDPLIIMGLLIYPQVAWAFNSRRMDHAFFLMTLVLIFVASLIVILVALGTLKYLEKRGRRLKSQARIVRALKLAPLLIAIIELILALLGAEFWRQF